MFETVLYESQTTVCRYDVLGLHDFNNLQKYTQVTDKISLIFFVSSTTLTIYI